MGKEKSLGFEGTIKGPGLITETWPVSRFVHYARNPRKNDAQVDRMVASIKEFGFRIPVVAKSDGSVVDGHLRLKAAVALGMTEVPVALADELTDARVKAFRLLANRSANWAEWDDELLALELSELGDMGFDMALTGFGDDELAALLAPGAGGEGAGDPGEARQTLAARFGIAPFSVLNSREGWWQDRKRAWLALGLQSELGRGGDIIPNGVGGANQQESLRNERGGTLGAIAPNEKQIMGRTGAYAPRRQAQAGAQGQPMITARAKRVATATAGR